MKLIPLFIIFVINCRSPASGGLDDIKEAKPGQFPFIASIEFNHVHLCSGFIHTESTIITSTACIFGKKPSDLIIKLRQVHLIKHDIGEQYVFVRTINSYEPYNSKQLSHLKNWIAPQALDLSILVLCTKIGELGDGIETIEIGTASILDNGKWKSMGWGDMKDHLHRKALNLRYGNLEVFDYKACLLRFGPHLFPETICCRSASTPPPGQYSANPCILDLGSPLIQGDETNQKVIGIASFIGGCSSTDIIIFTELSPFLLFIMDSIINTTISSTEHDALCPPRRPKKKKNPPSVTHP